MLELLLVTEASANGGECVQSLVVDRLPAHGTHPVDALLESRKCLRHFVEIGGHLLEKSQRLGSILQLGARVGGVLVDRGQLLLRPGHLLVQVAGHAGSNLFQAGAFCLQAAADVLIRSTGLRVVGHDNLVLVGGPTR